MNEDMFVMPAYNPYEDKSAATAAKLFSGSDARDLYDKFLNSIFSGEIDKHTLFGEILPSVAALADPKDKQTFLYYMNVLTGGKVHLPQLAWAHYEARVSKSMPKEPQTMLQWLKARDWGSVDDKVVVMMNVMAAILAIASGLRTIVTKVNALRVLAPAVGKIGKEAKRAKAMIQDKVSHELEFDFRDEDFVPEGLDRIDEEVNWDMIKKAGMLLLTLVSLIWQARRLMTTSTVLTTIVGEIIDGMTGSAAQIESVLDDMGEIVLHGVS